MVKTKFFNYQQIKFWTSTSITYGIIALLFSLIGFLVDNDITRDFRIGEQILESATTNHVLGHITFGMIIAIPTLMLRYIVTGGLFAIALDADHLIQFFGIEMISRTSHSIPFALISIVIIMFIFGRRDYLLGAISFAAVFSHVSLDILLGGGSKFPILFPIHMEPIVFGQNEWPIILLSATGIVFAIKILNIRLKKFQK